MCLLAFHHRGEQVVCKRVCDDCRYFDPETVGLDFEGMCSDIESAPEGSIIVLHGTLPKFQLYNSNEVKYCHYYNCFQACFHFCYHRQYGGTPGVAQKPCALTLSAATCHVRYVRIDFDAEHTAFYGKAECWASDSMRT